MQLVIYFLLALFATTVGSLTGMGGGVIIKPLMDVLGDYDVQTIGITSSITVFSVSTKTATVCSIITILFAQISKLATVAITTGFSPFDLSVAPVMITGAILGGFIGAGFNKKCSEKTVETAFTKADYDELLSEQVDALLKEEGFDTLTDEQKEAVFAEFGVDNEDDVKKLFRDMLVEELPYDDIASEMEIEGTWSLDGDTLTVELDGETVTVETGLSKGEKTINIVNEETGLDVSLKKA